MPRLIYERADYQPGEPLTIRVTIQHLTNHELRWVLLGFWRRLNENDQQDFIGDLNHYSGREDHELPGVAQVIAAAAEQEETMRGEA